MIVEVSGKISCLLRSIFSALLWECDGTCAAHSHLSLYQNKKGLTFFVPGRVEDNLMHKLFFQNILPSIQMIFSFKKV